MKPVHLPYEQLADILLDMSERVRAGDSWEGHIQYLADYDNDGEQRPLVEAAYRIGNSNGSQGGMRTVGDLV
jgi:hypothetical protein